MKKDLMEVNKKQNNVTKGESFLDEIATINASRVSLFS